MTTATAPFALPSTWSVSALVCLVTKKLDKLAKYAATELMQRSSHMNLCFIPSDKVTSKTSGSIKSVAGNKTRTAIGDIYSSKFMEFNFSPSEESRIPWRTDLNALAAVALMHIMNPYK